VSWNAVHGWITESSLGRRTAEALLRAAARRHLARLDRLAPARCQQRILLGLLHEAQTTRFGREHDFRRIRTTADFRRLVPLNTRAELWREYWQPVYPNLGGATWPPIKSGERTHQVSQSGLLSAHRGALRTALALVCQNRPRTRLLRGDLLFVSEERPSSAAERGGLAERLPTFVRPYARLSADAELESWASRSVSCLIGPVERMVPMLEAVKRIRGKQGVRDVWPELTAVLYTRRSPAAPVERLRAETDGVLLLEMAGRAEGPIAVEDPRHGRMRLLFNHGVYLEFVPPGKAGELHCPRLGIDEVELGIPYELAVTSPAGLWACHVGRSVCVEQRDPPLIRFVEAAVPPAVVVEKRRTRRTDLILPTSPLPEPHPQSADTPAALPGNSFHTPWSTLADRG
jgi:hypothetical protein